MDFSRFFTIKDFFNYYIAGTIWIADILFLIYIVNSSSLNNLWNLPIESETIPWIQMILELIIIIIIPYTLGFALQPLSAWITKKLRDNMIGDPIRCVTSVIRHPDDEHCSKYFSKNYYKGKHLPESAVDRIFKIAPDIFEYKLKEEQLWFYQIRAYVIDKGGPAVGLAERAQTLANLTESLIIPLPILCALVVRIIAAEWFAGLAILVALGMFYILFRRYLELRREWAIHIYREFLVITAYKKEDMSYN